jgi:LAGLIDADG endonuclease
VEHFNSFPLKTQKLADYKFFKEAYMLIINKEHMTPGGIEKLIALKASVNKGLTKQLKEAYPNIVPVIKEKIVNSRIPDPAWLAGFTSGEGSFLVKISKSSTHKLGYQVQLRFQITQQDRDKILMENIVKYLDCGYISVRGDIIDFQVVKISDITEKILPFFALHPIIGVKKENLKDFTKVVEMVNKKDHLTLEGLEIIKEIKSKMNAYRETF